MSVVLYKPANGVEGRLFEAELCSRCTKGVNQLGCLIMVDQYYCENTEDPEYPKQLVRNGEAAYCTDFEDKYDLVSEDGETIEVTGNVVELRQGRWCEHLTEESWLTVQQAARELTMTVEQATELLVKLDLIKITHLTRQELVKWGDVIKHFTKRE